MKPSPSLLSWDSQLSGSWERAGEGFSDCKSFSARNHRSRLFCGAVLSIIMSQMSGASLTVHWAGLSPKLRCPPFFSCHLWLKLCCPIQLQGNVRVLLTHSWPSLLGPGIKKLQGDWPVMETTSSLMAPSSTGPLCCLFKVLAKRN